MNDGQTSKPSHTTERSAIGSLWHSLPVLLRAVLSGVLVTAAGTAPWAILIGLNLKYTPEWPWAVPPTAVYLWYFWKYVRGYGWPQSTGIIRRQNCRAFRISDDVWPSAIGAGVLGIFALLLFQNVYGRLVKLPSESDDLSSIPTATIFLSIIMSALVAGITEESGMRGYMQRPLEEKYGPIVAILITGVVFGFMHFSHREVTIALMPWYMGVALVYGLIAYHTGSILPGVVLHAGGNMLGAFQVIVTGRPEWQSPSATPRLVWETGADTMFWLSVLAFAVAALAAVWAFVGLGRIGKNTRPIHT